MQAPLQVVSIYQFSHQLPEINGEQCNDLFVKLSRTDTTNWLSYEDGTNKAKSEMYFHKNLNCDKSRTDLHRLIFDPTGSLNSAIELTTKSNESAILVGKSEYRCNCFTVKIHSILSLRRNA